MTDSNQTQYGSALRLLGILLLFGTTSIYSTSKVLTPSVLEFESIPRTAVGALTVKNATQNEQPEPIDSEPILPSIINASELKLIYLHVGKTAGMTLNRVLRASCIRMTNKKSRQHCFSKLCCSDGELLLSKVTHKALHTYLQKPRMRYIMERYSEHDLLWTVRHPIHRLVSALDMAANAWLQFKTQQKHYDIVHRDCGFRTAEDLAEVLDFRNATRDPAFPKHRVIQISNTTTNFDCFDYGKQYLEGTNLTYLTHVNMGYHWYSSNIPTHYKNRTNLVLRTEHLWDDILQTNTMLVESESNGLSMNETNSTWINDLKKLSNYKYTHGSGVWKIKSNITSRHKEILCCYLSKENQVYEDLILSAINLSDEQKGESIEPLYRDCGILPLLSGSRLSGFDWGKWHSEGCPT